MGAVVISTGSSAALYWEFSTLYKLPLFCEMSAASPSNPNQMEAAQAQVQEVVGVMRNNIDKVLERDSKLSDLDNRASTLEASSSMFQQSSRRLRKKYWWQNLKMKFWLAGCSILILIVLILIIYFSVHKSSSGGEDNNNNNNNNSTV